MCLFSVIFLHLNVGKMKGRNVVQRSKRPSAVYVWLIGKLEFRNSDKSAMLRRDIVKNGQIYLMPCMLYFYALLNQCFR